MVPGSENFNFHYVLILDKFKTVLQNNLNAMEITIIVSILLKKISIYSWNNILI